MLLAMEVDIPIPDWVVLTVLASVLALMIAGGAFLWFLFRKPPQ